MIARATGAVALFVAAGCSGNGAGDAGARADGYYCTQEDFDRSTPVEEELVGLRAGELRRARGWDRFTNDGILLDGVGLPDGSLLAVISDYSIYRLALDGTITFVAQGRDFAYIAADDREVLRASTGERDAPAFRLELYPYDRPGPIGPSFPVELPSTCDAMRSYTPHISAGRYLVLRSNCDPVPDRRTVAERWALGDRLERVTEPREILEPTHSSYGQVRNAHADGRGGVFWVALENTMEGYDVRVGHWDGDGVPTYSEPLVATGTTTEFAMGRPYPDGRFLAATNHRVDGGRVHTTIALVGVHAETGQATIEWRWESPDVYRSGVREPALDAVGDGDVMVLLVQQSVGDTIFVQRLGPDGLPRWSEPRAVYQDRESLRLIGFEAEAAVTGHTDGSAHLLWANYDGGVRLLAIDPDGAPTWPTPINVGGSPYLAGKAISDGVGGVWVLLNDRSGTVQHFTADGWRLYRRWFVPVCGRVRGFFARPAPDAEPINYFGSDPLFGP